MPIKAAIELLDPDDLDKRLGSLQRFRRIRRWMVLVAALLVVVHERWIDYEPVTQFLQLSKLPEKSALGWLTVAAVVLFVTGSVAARQYLLRLSRREVHRRKALVDSELQKVWQEAMDYPIKLLDQKKNVFAQIDAMEAKGLLDKEFAPNVSFRQHYEQRLVAFEKDIMEADARTGWLKAELDADIARIDRTIKWERVVDVLQVLIPLLFLAYAIVVHGMFAILTPATPESAPVEVIQPQKLPS